MREDKKPKVLLEYAKKKLPLFLYLSLCTGIFWMVFSLYNLPAEAVGYAALACCSFWGDSSGFGSGTEL